MSSLFLKPPVHTPQRRAPSARRSTRTIVSSPALASTHCIELSEFEFALIVAWNAFSRWAVDCMAAAGCADLTITDVLVLHHLNHRARNKMLADKLGVERNPDIDPMARLMRALSGLYDLAARAATSL